MCCTVQAWFLCLSADVLFAWRQIHEKDGWRQCKAITRTVGPHSTFICLSIQDNFPLEPVKQSLWLPIWLFASVPCMEEALATLAEHSQCTDGCPVIKERGTVGTLSFQLLWATDWNQQSCMKNLRIKAATGLLLLSAGDCVSLESVTWKR